MKRTRHTPEQIIRKLKTADQLIAQGQIVAEACRILEISQSAYHRWRQLYGGMKAEAAKGCIHLEKESARLKRPLAEAELEKGMLKGLAEGNFCTWSGGAGPHGSAGALPGIPEKCQPLRGPAPQRHSTMVVTIEEEKLRRRLREIAVEHILWGRRMAHRLLRQEGWLVNNKRVHRLWREEGLQQPALPISIE
jgi:putative transposase